MRNWVVYLILAILVAIIIWYVTRSSKASSPEQVTVMTGSDTDLVKTMYKLWSENVIWTRLFFMASFNDAPNLRLVTNRLLKNQFDLGNSIIPYYGADAGLKFASLLRENILLCADIVESLKVQDTDMRDRSVGNWYKSAEQLAEFLGSINPYFNRQVMRDMLNDHMKFTMEELMAQYNRDWQGDISSFDVAFNQALMIADDMSAGITKQFR